MPYVPNLPEAGEVIWQAHLPSGSRSCTACPRQHGRRLQIQGEKLDAYAKSRTLKAAKATMLEAVRNDCAQRFSSNEAADKVHIHLAYSGTDLTEANIWKQEVQEAFPDHEIIMRPLSLSISCHIGPGAIAITATKMLDVL